MDSAVLYFWGSIVIFFGLLFWNYGQFAVTVCRWSKKPKYKKKNGKKVLVPGKVSTSEAVQCYIPWLQAATVRNALYKSAGPFTVLSVMSLVLFVQRLLLAFPLARFTTPLIQVISIYAFLTGIILTFITYGIVTADCAKMYGFAMSTVVLNFIAPCLFCFWLTNNIATVMKDMHKEETFSEHHTDTVIKQRHS